MADQQQYFCNKEGCDFRGTLEEVMEHEDEHDAAGDPSTAAAAAAAAAAGASTVSFTGVRGRFGFKRNPSARYMKLPFINDLNKGKYVIAAHKRAARDNTSHFREAAARQARTSQNVIFVCQTHGMYQANYGLERGKKDLKKLSKRFLEDLPKPVESINVCGGGGCCTLVNKWWQSKRTSSQFILVITLSYYLTFVS